LQLRPRFFSTRSPLSTSHTSSYSLYRIIFFFLMIRTPQRSPLFPYTTLFRSRRRSSDRSISIVCSRSPRRCRAAASLLPSREPRSEEHTSELQSLTNLVCRLLLEKKKVSCNVRFVLIEVLSNSQDPAALYLCR